MSIENCGNLIYKTDSTLEMETGVRQLLAENKTELRNPVCDHVAFPLETIELVIEKTVKPEKYAKIYKKIRNVVQDHIEALILQNPELEFRREGMWELGTLKIMKMNKSPPTSALQRHLQFSKRHLAFISLLTDSTLEVKFTIQNVVVSCKQGDLIFFPPYWTHLCEIGITEGVDVEILHGYIDFV